MIRKSLLTLGLVLIAANTVAEAADSSGTRGGGQSLDIDGRPSLKDLVEHTVCRWTTGAKVRDSLPGFQRILTKLAEVHWHYRNIVANAASGVNVCFTDGSLSRIDPKDQDGITIGELGGDQVAIRWDGTVYIDKKIFDRMDAKNKGFLFFHEIMHSFVPLTVKQRNIKLRSFVKATEEFSDGRLSQVEYLEQISADGVDWPSKKNFSILEPLRAQLTQFYSDDEVESMAAAVALTRWGGELYERGALSRDDSQRIAWRAEGASSDLFSAIAACDFAKTRRFVEFVKPALRVHYECRTFVAAREDMILSVMDSLRSRTYDGVIAALIAHSNANRDLGLDDGDCVDTLRYVLSIENFTLARVQRDYTSRPYNSEISWIKNPALWSLFESQIQAQKQREAERAEKARLDHLQTAAKFVAKCAPDANCATEVLLSISRKLEWGPAAEVTFTNPTNGESLAVQPSELRPLAGQILANPAFDAIEVGRRLKKHRVKNWSSLGIEPK